ncbi:hypothetical protein [Halovenus sp. HT40]|uniref:hypothetical protein n=1 Tax=Halovenus sp. HT40 TaxID=3126691 RepID=UPI00300F1B64
MAEPNEDYNFISQEEFAELAAEYRDELLKSLGVLGHQRSPSHSAPGEKLRDYPVEAPVGHRGTHESVGQRILTDVTDYDDDLDIPASNDIQYMTIRTTTGLSAIYSSATIGLGWETVPTPREVRLAEYLVALDESDLSPNDYKVSREGAADMLIETLFPRDITFDQDGLWISNEETAVSNVYSIKDCVSMVTQTHGETTSRLQRVHGTDDFGDETDVFSRWEFGNVVSDKVVVESYTGPDHTTPSPDRRHRVYVYDPSEGSWQKQDESTTTVNGWGYVETESAETELYTIPEFATPEDVLDLPRKTPENPHADGDADE